MNGGRSQTLRELKALDPEAKVIMLTALIDEGLARQALAEGAFEYITKPFSSDHLETALITLIRLNRVASREEIRA